MRLVLNTRTDDAVARACIYELAERLRGRGLHAVVNDWGSYGSYDVAVFLAYDHELEAARAANPAIRVVLADPKQRTPQAVATAQAADLLLVSSVEQRDAFLRTSRNLLVFTMFPDIPARQREHADTLDPADVFTLRHGVGDSVVVRVRGVNGTRFECVFSGTNPLTIQQCTILN